LRLRYAIVVLLALACLGSGRHPAVAAPGGPEVAARAVPGDATAANRITITNRSGGVIGRYPLQFGRPFLDGAIAHSPQVLLDGRTIPTQADIKNRYPDGSVAFAVIAVVIPDLRPGVPRTLTFADSPAHRNVPLTRAQMLDPAYDFDVVMRLTAPNRRARLLGRPVPPALQAIAVWHTITDGGFALSVGGSRKIVTGIDLSHCVFSTAGDPRNCGTIIDRAIAAVIPGAATYQAPQAWQIGLAVPGSAGPIGYAGPPPAGQDLSAIYGWTRTTAASLTQASTGASGTASARTMLANGDYKLWTAGPVAQTIMLADDSPARKYDIGFGDGYHPFRPRFYATFWPQTHQVFVRAVGENDLITELEDLFYKLSISAGYRSPRLVYAADLSGDQKADPKTDAAMTVWTRRFWLGGAPPDQVDVDYHLAYLTSTRFIPNYDPTVTISAGTIAAEYADYWTKVRHDLYDGAWDGGGPWQSGMGTPGDRQDIAPEPAWDVYWLYTGDWRMRALSLGAADLAGAWPMNLRESDPTKRLLISDPVPGSDRTGTGYGRPFSVTDRRAIGPVPMVEGLGELLYHAASQGAPAADLPKVVGPLNQLPHWSSEGSHEPDPFYVPYLLTGDPFYLQMLESWAAFDVASDWGLNISNWQGRGPTGAEGGAFDELRGCAWLLVHRAETAFAIPDGDPLKTYFIEETNSDIARWEGALGIAGTVFDGTAEKNWAIKTGDPMTGWGAGINGQLPEPTGGPPLGNWESEGDPSAVGSYIHQRIWSKDAGTFTEPWMQWFVLYAVGRAADLGFAAGPLERHTGKFLTGLILDSGHPELIGAYLLPIASVKGPFYASWAQMTAVMSPSYLDSADPASFPGSSGQAPIKVFFAHARTNVGYPANAWAALAELANQPVTPQIRAALAWMKTNLYLPVRAAGGWDSNPAWDLLPYSGPARLPAMPTAQP